MTVVYNETAIQKPQTHFAHVALIAEKTAEK